MFDWVIDYEPMKFKLLLVRISQAHWTPFPCFTLHTLISKQSFHEGVDYKPVKFLEAAFYVVLLH